MDTIQAELSELSLRKVQELRAVYDKLSIIPVIDLVQSMNEALKEIVFEEEEFNLTARKGYAHNTEVRIKAMEQIRKNLEFMFKVASIPIELAKGTQKEGTYIETITPLALPSSDD